MPDAIVLGAGISGLAAAWELRRQGHSVLVLEARERPGGVIRSVRKAGYLFEEGPHTLMERSVRLMEIMEAVGLYDRRIPARPEARNRFIVRDGKPVPLPLSPLAFLRSPLLSARGKARVLLEPFIAPAESEDEPLSRFITRRLGAEVLDYLVEPFVAGIYAGDPDRLSTRYAFPQLFALEQEGGSLFRGMLRKRRQAQGTPSTSRGGMFSFPDGLQMLPDALARHLRDALVLGAEVMEALPVMAGWRVRYRRKEEEMTVEAPVLISTLPVYRADRIFPFQLPEVVYAPVVVLGLGFRRRQIAHPLNGFGLLVPRREPFRILGVLFPSSLFPERAPEGHVLLSVFLGGLRHPEDVHIADDALLELALQDLASLLGVRGAPEIVHLVRHTRAIPQYELGYGEVLRQLDRLEGGYPGLFFAGNYRKGVAVHQALESGLEAAERAHAHPTFSA